eukprot:1072705-Rhodomonas_salina.4
MQCSPTVVPVPHITERMYRRMPSVAFWSTLQTGAFLQTHTKFEMEVDTEVDGTIQSVQGANAEGCVVVRGVCVWVYECGSISAFLSSLAPVSLLPSSSSLPSSSLAASASSRSSTLLPPSSSRSTLAPQINFDLSFPAMPCSILSVDYMDVSGEHEL